MAAQFLMVATFSEACNERTMQHLESLFPTLTFNWIRLDTHLLCFKDLSCQCACLTGGVNVMEYLKCGEEAWDEFYFCTQLLIRCLQLDIKMALPLFLEIGFRNVSLLDIAKQCAEYPETCKELINHSSTVEVMNAMLGDDNNLAFNRMLMDRLLREDPCNADLWIKAIGMEGERGEQIALLRRGLMHCNDAVLWAEYLSLVPDGEKEALYGEAVEKCKDMLIHYAQYLMTCGKHEQVIQELEGALQGTEEDLALKEKAAVMLCQLDPGRCADYLKEYPRNELLWREACNVDDGLYQRAVKACPTSTTLWVSYAKSL